jgi:hypothetical protein
MVVNSPQRRVVEGIWGGRQRLGHDNFDDEGGKAKKEIERKP